MKKSKRARSWSRIGLHVVGKLTAAIGKLTSDEPRVLRATKAKAGSGNCWFAVFQLREFLTEQAERELHSRRFNHRKLLAAARRALRGKPTGIRGFP